jgi:tyrosyl-tRNA synthetase
VENSVGPAIIAAAMDLVADLAARGLVHDSTDRDALSARLAAGPLGLYIGFDPTADSLHAGNLVGQLFMRRFQLQGHRPFALAGGATGMIGDPGGRSEERNLLDVDTLRHNVECIKVQLTRILDFEPGPYQATLVNNADWTQPVTMLEFLRDVGKHFTVNQMMAKESVRSRIESDHGISYTEFSYMLLQANDYRHLYETHGVELQAGASDQWGNILAGVELIRRRLGAGVHALTHPLITKADGTKFGKSVSGAVWLDPNRTSPYQFRQFWMQCDDEMIATYLRMLSLQPLDEVNAVIAAHEVDPGKRLAQRALATEMTSLVHGAEAAAAANDAAGVLFGGDPMEASADAFAVVHGELGSHALAAAVLADLPAALVELGLATSNGDARRTLQQRGYRANGVQLAATDDLSALPRLHGRYVLLRRGRSDYRLLEIS